MRRNTTKFLPGFHRQLFGRKPVSSGSLLARKAQQADTLCLSQLHTLFENVLPLWLATFKASRGTNSRHCIYTTLVTFWAFLSQVLDPDGSCRHDFTIIIENAKGANRSKYGKDGKVWTKPMHADYGFIRGGNGFRARFGRGPTLGFSTCDFFASCNAVASACSSCRSCFATASCGALSISISGSVP